MMMMTMTMQASFRKKIKAFTDTWSGVVELNCQGFEEVKRHWAEFVQSQKGIHLTFHIFIANG